MISIIQFINEKLTINSKSNIINNDEEVLNDILAHFEFDNLYEIDKSRLQKEPYITNDDVEEIKNQLLDFIKENNISKESLKYYIRKGHKFKNTKIAKDYKKDNTMCYNISMKIEFAKDKKRIFKKDSLYFEVSSKAKIIEMCGPYGGAKYCTFK